MATGHSIPKGTGELGEAVTVDSQSGSGDLGIDPLLELSEAMETTGGDIMGLGSDLSTLIDPALMAALGELGLSEDLNTLSTLENATRLLLDSGVQRGRLARGFEREQELTGANLAQRGIMFSPSAAEGGLIAEVGSELARSQGERLADFESGTGNNLTALLTGLGQQGQINATEIGKVLLGGITGNLNDAVSQASG